jgi:hypothetical protein
MSIVSIGYFSFENGHSQAPLLYCISQIIHGGEDLEYYLLGVIGKDPMEPVGGDPGWQLYSDLQKNGTELYYAWVDEEMTGIEPNEGWYDEKTVKFYIREGLENVLKEQPNRKIEIEKIFKKYNL